MILLSAIIATFEADYRAQMGDSILPSQLKALEALKTCRTSASPLMRGSAGTAATRSSSRTPVVIAPAHTASTMRANNGSSVSSPSRYRRPTSC